MTFEPSALNERITSLSDGELLRMVGEEAEDYMPEALALAKQEVERRGIAEKQGFALQKPEDSDVEDEDGKLGSNLKCPACGSPLRPALLLGETQVIALFEDNREQRFVRMQVCPECGTADLFVDFETDVED